jgi:hypothetical protein
MTKRDHYMDQWRERGVRSFDTGININIVAGPCLPDMK